MQLDNNRELTQDTHRDRDSIHSSGVTTTAYPAGAEYPVRDGGKKVSIIMPTQNHPRFLARALASVLEQTYENWHLYLINNGGNSAEVEQCVSAFKELIQERLTLVHYEHCLGMEAIINNAAEIITSEYSVVHNDDDSWDKEFLDECVDFLSEEANSAYGGVVAHTTLIREIVTEDEIKFVEEADFNPWTNEIELSRLLEENTFAPISFMFKTQLFKQVGLLNNSLPMLGDCDFNIRVLLVSDLAVLPKKLAFYHQRIQSDLNSDGSRVVEGKNIRYRNAILRNSIKEAPWLAGLLLGIEKKNCDLKSQTTDLNNQITDLKNQINNIEQQNHKTYRDLHELLNYHMSYKHKQIELAEQSLDVSLNTYKLVNRIFRGFSIIAKPILFIKRKFF